MNKVDSAEKKLRQPIVVVLGHVDHGKCLHPDEIVFLNNGRFVPISELFDKNGNIVKDGEYEYVNGNIEVYTLDGGKIVARGASQVWRIKYDGELLEVELSNGSTVRVTPDHPFLTIEGWKKARAISTNDYIAVPKKVPYRKEFSEFLKEVLDKHGFETSSFETDCEAVESNAKDWYFEKYVADKVEAYHNDNSAGNITENIFEHLESKELWQEAFYIAGVMAGLNETIDKVDILDCPHSEYEKNIATIIDPSINNSSSVYFRCIRLILKEFFNYPKIKYEEIPEIVQIAPINISSEFLKGFFDVRGEVDLKCRRIMISHHSKIFLKQIKWLLLRYGIISTFFEENGGGNIIIEDYESLKNYTKYIGFKCPSKRRLLNELVSSSFKGISVREGNMESSTILLKDCLREMPQLDDIAFIRVKGLKKVKFNGALYDLTVPATQNFIANGIIVHNTTLLDKIRGTAVARREPGSMTQHVGASLIPTKIIENICKPLKKIIPISLRIPGLLFIDTPGHELFSNLRMRGGSVADIAILVVDIISGFQEQTYESIEILRQRKVPFLIAANKIDRIHGWKPQPGKPFLLSIRKQDPNTIRILDDKIYEIIGEMFKLGFKADRFDRIRDFTRNIAIVPVSAVTGEGIPELLAVLAGLTQQYMAKRLIYAEGPGKGVVLEVKEEPGLGATVDIILYDGIIRKNDLIVVGGMRGPIVTKIRALLMPKPLQEIRSPEDKFMRMEEVSAAVGVKIAAPNLDDTIAGSPLYVVWETSEIEKYKKKVEEELQEVRIKKEISGVIVKADALGTLEAIVNALKRRGIPVRLADVGPITKRDIIEASITARTNKYYGVILAFNVKILPGVEEEAAKEGVKIFMNNVIYRLIEEYEDWLVKMKEEEKRRQLATLIRPGKIRILPGYVFRRSAPIVVGVEVLGGVIKPGYPVMRKDCRRIGEILQIQDRGKPIPEARTGMQVAISIKGKAIVGRHIEEGDLMYTDMSERDISTLLTKFRSELSDDELLVLKEIVKLKRKIDPLFAPFVK